MTIAIDENGERWLTFFPPEKNGEDATAYSKRRSQYQADFHNWARGSGVTLGTMMGLSKGAIGYLVESNTEDINWNSKPDHIEASLCNRNEIETLMRG